MRLVWLMFFGEALGVLAQFPVSESIRVAQDVSQALGLEAELAQHVLEAALPADRCLGHWQAQRDSLERAAISEDALMEQVTAIQAAMKACRADRNAAMRAALPDSLHPPFDDFRAPAKPAVLHFGLHNRMDCVVCKPE